MAASNSLERVLSVLQVFSEDRLEWTPEEMMAELGYSRPTLYRYLKTLKDAGLLTSTPNAGFSLGPKIVEMDYLLRKSDALSLNGQPYIEDLAGRYPCTALLVRWYGKKILCVASECSTPDPLSSYPRGRPMPLARGAISRSIMAFLPRRQLLPMVKANLDELSAVGLGDTVEEILDSYRRVRKAGFATAQGEVTAGVTGFAAPIFDAGKSPIASICLTIASAELTPDREIAISRDIARAGAELSNDLSDRRNALDEDENDTMREREHP
ncbi:IclR family transcriptional regulator [Hoeflea sp. WL0058]|uniref:IclR family transcriptional regulator n=1 Tax=Flavimaribacter sediminis TaxID=2865987 RepID=A0AAE2ZQ26_9HYPH|nr:IclR family transcriptional regulator [Flavimaribacter sediminis]MBW8638652.1 IclR family transcriptional regulator [Flavimaribacter sediminis]